MAQRITDWQLDALAQYLNTLTGSPKTYMSVFEDGTRQINIGHWHIDRAYGGVSLHRTMNASGGVTQPMGSGGHITKRELYDQMHAFIKGMQFQREQMTAHVSMHQPAQIRSEREHS